MAARPLLVVLTSVFLVLSVACSPDAPEPKPKDWVEDQEVPGPDRTEDVEPTPSPSPSESRRADEGDRERYKDIDLESGEDIPEGSCGEYDEPTSTREWQAILRCNPGHDYGSCGVNGDPVGGQVSIFGTSGDDILVGTTKDELICGLGGNDIIVGGGGEDSIWGGPGNDYIEGGRHSDFLYGGDGDDILIGRNSCVMSEDSKCGVDFLVGDDDKRSLVDTGDDVLLGGVLSQGENINAGPGNDIISPTVARIFGHDIVAGDGNDVVMTLNFSHGGNTDHVNLGSLEGKVKLGIPIGKTCNVTAELDLRDPKNSDEGKVTCSLPWPSNVSKLNKVFPLTASVDQEGKVSMDATLYNKLASLSVSDYRGMTDFQASLGGDVCICDPLMNPPPTEPFMPYDYDSSTN